MADKVTTVKELKLVAKFVDNDTRTIPLDNPKNNLTAADVKAFEATAKTTKAIIGDKTGADFNSIERAIVYEKETTNLDLR